MSIILETKRLVLKPISLSDFDNIYALRSDPDVMGSLDDGSIHTKERVKKFIESVIGYFEQYGLDFFSVFEKEASEFVGQAGLFQYVKYPTLFSDSNRLRQ